MSEIRVKDLLQAKALGCLDTSENEVFLKLMEEDNEFPWQEFGQYQNLVAHMPTLLELETPDQKVKKIILKEFQNHIKVTQSKIDINKENTTDSIDTIEVIEDENLIIEEEEFIPPTLPQTDTTNINKAIIKNGIAIKEPEKPEIDINAFKTAKQKLTEDKKNRLQKGAIKKGLSDKQPKNYVSKFEQDEKVTRGSRNKLLTIAGIVIVIILTFLLIMYLGLSSEIDKNKNEIERLKKRIGLTLIYEESFPLESRLT